jgi:hypothetical protein
VRVCGSNITANRAASKGPTTSPLPTASEIYKTLRDRSVESLKSKATDRCRVGRTAQTPQSIRAMNNKQMALVGCKEAN